MCGLLVARIEQEDEEEEADGDGQMWMLFNLNFCRCLRRHVP